MKKTLLILCFLAMTLIAKAVDFKYDGVTYTILSDANKTVSTKAGTYSSPGHSGISGQLRLHDKVAYDGAYYTLTKIGDYSFTRCSALTGSLTIPNSVTSIGVSAFSGCSGLTGSLTIPESVTFINDYAFSGCPGFTGSLTIPNSVRTIGEYAFYGCTGFTSSLTLPNLVITIGEYAFYGCTGFTGSLTIPNSVTKIGASAFKRCSGFTGSLTIPNSVKTIGNYAFEDCIGFTGSLTIGNSVTTIGHYAFSGCSGFSGSLTIPNSVTVIGDAAFWNCTGFSGTLTITNSVTQIGGSAFAGCSGFTGSLTIPTSVTEIGEKAFLHCTSFKEINVKRTTPPTLGFDAFVYSIPLTVPFGCKDAYTKAANWKYFTKINEESISVVVNGIDYNLLSGEAYVTGYSGSLPSSLEIPASITYQNKSYTVTEILENAFANCSVIEKVVIPASITKIGSKAFYNCISLTDIKVNPTTPPTIYSDTFSNYSATLTVPKGCKDLYAKAEYWKNFQKIYDSQNVVVNGIKYEVYSEGTAGVSGYSGALPSSLEIPSSITYQSISYPVTEILKNAFANCTVLQEVILPPTITSVSTTAFSGCNNLKKCAYPNNIANPFSTNNVVSYSKNDVVIENKTIYNAAKTGLYYVSITASNSFAIPSGVTNIGDRAFSGCVNLKSVTIPATVTTIGSEAFRGCTGFTGSLTIPNSVTSIGSYAFYDCSGFTSLNVPASVQKIDQYAFGNCSRLTDIKVNRTTPPTIYSNTFSNYSATLTVPFGCKDGYTKAEGWKNFTKINEESQSVVINAINYDIYSSGNAVVSGYSSGLSSSLEIPSSITYQNKSYPVTEISNNAFANCSVLQEVILPPTITSVSTTAFSGCNNLKKCAYPNNIAKPFSISNVVSYSKNDVVIENKTIYNAKKTGLYYVSITASNSFTIPSGVTNIGDRAFSGCVNLKSVTIPATVTTIGTYAFYDCTGFTSLNLPASVNNIGSAAFYGCSGLTVIKVNRTTPPTIYSNTFSNYSATLTVPFGCKDVYAKANYWKNFTKINEESQSVVVNGINYNLSSGEATVTGYTGSLPSSLEIPSSITFENKNYTVKGISNNAFANCTVLQEVILPPTITSVSSTAFSGCNNLKKCAYPNNIAKPFSISNVVSYSKNDVVIENKTIYNAKKTGLYYASITASNSFAIPNGVTTIGDRAFSYCVNLKSVTIPATVTTIGTEAFRGCTGLKGALTLPNSVTSIGSSAFYDCSGLTGSLTIPNSMTTINDYTFRNCSGFTSLTIPASVNNIGSMAFYGCSGLKDIHVGRKTPPTIFSDTFSNYSATLTVPFGCENLYANAAYWKNFKDINTAHGIYLGVLGFNNEISEKPIAVLDESSVNGYTSWVNNLTLDRNTLLYYTVDQAIDKLQNHNFGVKLANTVIITFTDGLDQGSLAYNTGMSTSRDYANYLSNKIATTKIQDIGLKAYTIGVQGNDVVDDDLFMTNLKSLSSKPENVHHITNINQIEEKFDAIYQDLEMQKNQLILRLTVPMMENGATYRFTLDGATSAEASKVYVQGTYNSTYKRLERLQYTGFTSANGTTVAAVQNGINLTYTFEDCRDKNGEILSLPSKNAIAEWTYIPSSNKWQPNSEMSDTDIDLEKRNTTAIMLLIDCSSSLGDSDFSKLKYTANTFIERLIDYRGNYNGVEDVMVDEDDDSEIDWTDAEYYNLQGVRVMNPSSGFYIRRVGKHVQKVLLR